jgi:hypothetical protein
MRYRRFHTSLSNFIVTQISFLADRIKFLKALNKGSGANNFYGLPQRKQVNYYVLY